MDMYWRLCPSKHIKLVSVVFDICLLPSPPTHLWLSLKLQLREWYKQLPSPGCGMTRPLAAQLVADICWPDSVALNCSILKANQKPRGNGSNMMTTKTWAPTLDHTNSALDPCPMKLGFASYDQKNFYMFSSAKLCKHATFRHLKRQQHSTTFTPRHVVSAAASHLMVVFATSWPWWAVSLGRYVNLLTVHGTCTKQNRATVDTTSHDMERYTYLLRICQSVWLCATLDMIQW